jgi:hypothetical protein
MRRQGLGWERKGSGATRRFASSHLAALVAHRLDRFRPALIQLFARVLLASDAYDALALIPNVIWA